MTVRDQVTVEARLAAELGDRRAGRPSSAARWAACASSSGRSRTPGSVDRALVLASTAYATADQIAWAQPQLLAIRSDPAFRGGDYYDEHDRLAGPEAGMGIARRIAHVTYRSGTELDERFGREPQGARGAARATAAATPWSPTWTTTPAKLSRRFDANSYLVLTEAMNSHDVGRDRGGVAAALRTRHGDRPPSSPSTPTGSTPSGSATRSPPAYRERRSTPSRPHTDTTGSSSRSTRWARTSATPCADPAARRLVGGVVRGPPAVEGRFG